MEIKSVEKEKAQYPKSHEINNKQIKRCIPIKWLKLGITTAIFEIIMKSKVNAVDMIATIDTTISGDEKVIHSVYSPVAGITRMAAIVMFVISIIGLILSKIKKSKNTKLKKIFEVLLILSIVVFIIIPILNIVRYTSVAQYHSIIIASAIIFVISTIGLILSKIKKSKNTKLKKVFLVFLILSIEIFIICHIDDILINIFYDFR